MAYRGHTRGGAAAPNEERDAPGPHGRRNRSCPWDATTGHTTTHRYAAGPPRPGVRSAPRTTVRDHEQGTATPPPTAHSRQGTTAGDRESKGGTEPPPTPRGPHPHSPPPPRRAPAAPPPPSGGPCARPSAAPSAPPGLLARRPPLPARGTPPRPRACRRAAERGTAREEFVVTRSARPVPSLGDPVLPSHERQSSRGWRRRMARESARP